MFANVADKQAVAQILFYPFIIPLLQSQGTNHFFPHFLPSQIKLSPPAWETRNMPSYSLSIS